MTVTRSASGTRIDCDHCDDYAAAPRVAVEILRRATGYVRHDDRDYCADCWKRRTSDRFGAGDTGPPWDVPPAA